MANSDDSIDRVVEAIMKARPWIVPTGPFSGIPNFPDPNIKLVFVDSRSNNLVPPLQRTQNAASDGLKTTKTQKNLFYTPSMTTINTGFSFSIIHFLSAIRVAMISPLSEYCLKKGKLEVDAKWISPNENKIANGTNHLVQAPVPSLTVQEIVNRLKSNPGDPLVLGMQELLEDLVRRALMVFSLNTTDLSGKGWKALVWYEKSTKRWSWIGPGSHTCTDYETIVVTSPEYWGLPYKMLSKLVDSFANWLKNCQEILQQVESRSAIPLSLMECSLYEKECFKVWGCQNSLNAISPCSEVREYFRKEEFLRYSFPDKAFSYTAADGKKSIVAPLTRCRTKSIAQDHFMLKLDRLPHVTIRSLVRDAAARLPGGIGSKVDICTLMRDSQYIVEDVHDAHLNHVVGRALDRLHSQQDPCVKFDGQRRVWVYLHRDREEEDFDGDQDTSKWNRERQKKVPAEQDYQRAATVVFHSTDLS